MLQLLLNKKLRLHTSHGAARIQCALRQQAHQTAAGAAVYKVMPVCADPAAQLPDSRCQCRIAAFICPKIDCNVHGVSPFCFFSFYHVRHALQSPGLLANKVALWYACAQKRELAKAG